MKNLAIFGSTGSIGTQTLEVVRTHPQCFSVTALAAGSNAQLLAEQALEFRPRVVSLEDITKLPFLKEQLKDIPIEIRAGASGTNSLAAEPDLDLCVIAIVGLRALAPTLQAIQKECDIALASKEVLVGAGALVMRAVQEHQVKILPLDSEHSAIFQCLQGSNKNSVETLTLTASGGSLLHKTKKELAEVSLKEVLNHPNWEMGRKITVDSATLMNKGLEIIEAHWLFDIAYDNLKVVVHPESIIHSLVHYMDGSVIAQLGLADMRIPIQYALSYPKRLSSPWPRLDLCRQEKLTFLEPDTKTFACLDLAFSAAKAGGTYPLVLNAANEKAVELYLQGKIKFLDIPKIIEKALDSHKKIPNPSLEEILHSDCEVRKKCAVKIPLFLT